MSVRIAYDPDGLFDVDPAEESHAEQLRRIDAEDARRHQAREAEHTPPHSDGSRPPVAEGPSSAGGRPLQTPSAPVYLTEADMPEAVAERIAEGHTRLLAHGRRVHAEHGGRDLDRPADDDDLRVVEETNVPVAHQRDWNNAFVHRIVLRVRQEQTRAEKAEAALEEAVDLVEEMGGLNEQLLHCLRTLGDGSLLRQEARLLRRGIEEDA